MPLANCQAILGMGVFFILVGIACILWNRREKRDYYDSLTGRRDLKEFITHEPRRPWLSAWQIGGISSISVGVVLAIIGVVLWLVA